MIRKGDRIQFRPEFQDAGDDQTAFVAAEDEDGGRVLVMAMLGLPINPTQVVAVEMIEPAAR